MRVDKHAKRRKLLNRFGIDFRDLSRVQKTVVSDLRAVEYVRYRGDSYEVDFVGRPHFVRASRYESHDLYRFQARNGLSFVWDATIHRVIPSEYEKCFK